MNRLEESMKTLTNVFDVVSLICWSLVIIISIKYLVLVMRADNDGEACWLPQPEQSW